MKRLKNIFKPKEYTNIVEACILIGSLRKILGISIFNIKSSEGNVITSTFTFVGFSFFVLWHSLYFYSVYNVYFYDQSILRVLYDTQLKHYGDLVENIATTTYVVYAMWKISFDLSGATKHMQQIVNIDRAIKNLGEHIDYTKNSTRSLLIPFSHVFLWVIRSCTIWISTKKIIDVVPYSKIYQVLFSDSLAFASAIHYCVYLFILRDRYRRVNKILVELQIPTNEEFFIVRTKKPASMTAVGFKDRRICEKISNCGKIYSMLFKATEIANDKFGLALLLILFVWLILIVLYLYYFMEATAAGLFHDVDRYTDFLIYVFWQIIFAIGIMSAGIYFCEMTVKEAKFTSFVAHTMINSNLDSSIKEEARNISLQVIHQTPKFTARGLFPVEYMLLLEGARSVVTFLIILLQFATDKTY